MRVARKKDCEAIGRWSRSIVRHFYWAVTSTLQHLSDVKYAKFEALLSHILNIHTFPIDSSTNVPMNQFQFQHSGWHKVYHGEDQKHIPLMSQTSTSWSSVSVAGSTACGKISDILTSTTLVKAIKNSSSAGQNELPRRVSLCDQSVCPQNAVTLLSCDA